MKRALFAIASVGILAVTVGVQTVNAERVGRAEGMGKPYLWRLRPEFRG